VKVLAATRIMWSTIEKDPEAWASAAKIPTLVAAIKAASAAYYNTGKSKISDAAFDVLWETLQKRSPNNPILRKVGSAPAAGSSKIKLPYPMPSLDKKKQAVSIDRWIDDYEGPYVLSDKLDGVSLMIEYTGRGKYNLYTRGNGSTGQDITAFGKHLNIPKVNGTVAVRAELIVPKSKLDSLLKKSGNPDSFNLRNYVSGLVNRKDDSPGLKNVKIVAYEILKPRMAPSAQFAKLKSMGFAVAPNTSVKNLSIDVLNAALERRLARSKYDIDGIVVCQDKRNSLYSSNPPYAFAFKSHAQSQQHRATVVQVHWRASKDGYLKPRVEIEPVKDATGVTIRYVTAHNGLYVYENKIGKGAVLEILRSGGVIPYISGVLKKARKPDMPNEDWEWTDSGVDLVLKDFSANDTVLLRRLNFFFATLGVEGLRSGTLARLVDIGLDTPTKIIKASATTFAKAEGIQSRTAQKIRRNLEAIPDILSRRASAALVDEVASVSMFSTKLAAQFVEGLPKFQKFYKSLGLSIRTAKPRVRRTSNRLSGKVIVFTGFRDARLANLIEKHGGTIANSVSNKVTTLVVKEHKGSMKERKAESLGIETLTIDDFTRKYEVA